MNAVPETKPRKREPKPVPAPLGVSDKGRKRYRPKVDEFAKVTAERDFLAGCNDILQKQLAEAEALARTWRTRILLLVPAAGVGFVGGWLW